MWILPTQNLLREARFERLRRMLACSDPQADAAFGLWPAIRPHCRGLTDSAPLAALSGAADGLDTRQGLWLRADPVYLQADLRTVRMLHAGAAHLPTAEWHALAAALAAYYAEEGLRYHAPHPDRGYLQLPSTATDPGADAPDAMLGLDLMHALPEAPEWRRRLNEIQMWLKLHPLSDSWQARGEVPVNSLWFWGYGEFPPTFGLHTQAVASDDPLLRALALAAQVPVHAAQAELGGPVWRDLRDPDQLEAWLERAPQDFWQAGQVASISGQRWQVRRWHRWRWWRR